MTNSAQVSIVFDKEAGVFLFGKESVSFEDIGSDLAEAIQANYRFVGLGDIQVTPNYLIAMMKFAATNGWFVDHVNRGGDDHDFDANEPTPGAHWQKVRTLRQMARDEAALAIQLEDAGRFDLAAQHKRLAREKAREAEELGKMSEPKPPVKQFVSAGDKVRHWELWIYYSNGEGTGFYCTSEEEMVALAQQMQTVGEYRGRKICRCFGDSTVRTFFWEAEGSPLPPPQAAETGFHPSTWKEKWQPCS